MSKKKDKVEHPQSKTPISESSSGVNRRRFVQGAAGLGLSAAALSGLFSGYHSGFSPAFAAGYDAKEYAGTKINFLLVGGESIDRALADLMPEMKAETGIEVEITAPAIGPLISKTLQNLQAERSAFELIMYLGFLTTQQVGSGYYQQLNAYIENDEETPSDWDFQDFIPAALRNVGIYDMAAGKVGQGSDVYGIPSAPGGSGLYFYRKDLFDAAGLKPAKTWEEFHAAAKTLTKDGVAGASFIGANDISLGLIDWYTRFITSGGVLMSGNPGDKDFMPQIDTPEGTHALQLLIDLLPYAPKSVTQYGFAENVDGFSAGKIAQMIFWSTIAGPVFNPETSIVADKAATATVPAAPGQKPRSIQGGWGIGIPKNSDPAKKAAAWRALTWITSKRANIYEVDKYQITVQRTSAFEDQGLLDKFPYLKDSRDAIATAQTIPIARINEFFQLMDTLNVELNAALIGSQDAKTATAKIQAQWEAILRKAGHLA
ncbi:MAG: extracellular solute-binding protein [Alphaproteobacteria bacterium]